MIESNIPQNTACQQHFFLMQERNISTHEGFSDRKMHLDSFCTPLSFQYVAESGGIKIKLNYSNPLPTTGVTFLKNITIHKTYHYSPAPSMRMSLV